MKRYGVCIFVLTIVIALAFQVNTYALDRINVLVNDVQLRLDQEPIMREGRTFVPVRGIFEAVDAKVEWDSQTNKITASKGLETVQIRVGENIALVNGRTTVLDASPFVLNGRTLVPLRFVTEALGSNVSWDGTRQTISIRTRDYLPPTREELEAVIHSTEEEVIRAYGQPKQRTVSEYGFQWSSFHENYENFALIGFENSRAVALYSNNNDFLKKYNLTTNTTKTSTRTMLGEPLKSIKKGNVNYSYESRGDWDLFRQGEVYLTVFYDVHKNDTVTALLAVKMEVENSKAGYFGDKQSNELRLGFEKQLFDITNALRVREGVPALQWNEAIANTARKHSNDMAEHNYFAHENLKGQSPFDRMKTDGITFRTAGENLAVGQFNAIFAHEALMNSENHRKNILNPKFERLGVGVAFGERNRPYFTQKYFTPR